MLSLMLKASCLTMLRKPSLYIADSTCGNVGGRYLQIPCNQQLDLAWYKNRWAVDVQLSMHSKHTVLPSKSDDMKSR